MISFSFYLLRININLDISSCVRFTGGAYNRLRKDGQDEQLSELFTIQSAKKLLQLMSKSRSLAKTSERRLLQGGDIASFYISRISELFEQS